MIYRGHFSYALRSTPQEQLEAVRDHMNETWFNFMKTGDPRGGNVNWTKYDGKFSMLHLFGLQPTNQSIHIEDMAIVVWDKMGLLYDKE